MLGLNKRLDDNMLKMVAGGDFGDADKDNDPNKSWYEVGQGVEVYNTFFHKTTRNSTIEAKRFDNGYWEYRFTIFTYDMNSKVPHRQYVWYSANAIER